MAKVVTLYSNKISYHTPDTPVQSQVHMTMHHNLRSGMYSQRIKKLGNYVLSLGNIIV